MGLSGWAVFSSCADLDHCLSIRLLTCTGSFSGVMLPCSDPRHLRKRRCLRLRTSVTVAHTAVKSLGPAANVPGPSVLFVLSTYVCRIVSYCVCTTV